MTPQDFIAKWGVPDCVPGPSANTVQATPWALCDVLGSAHTGLQGPYAAGGVPEVRPHRWHMNHRWNRKIPGDPDTMPSPERVNAAVIPSKHLRGLLQNLAQRFSAHEGGPSAVPANLDLALPITLSAIPREDTRLLLTRWQNWFAKAYAHLQHKAVANGRWFPPPTSLQLTRQPDGTATAVARFTPGYLALGRDECAACHPRPPAPPRSARPTLRDALDPLPPSANNPVLFKAVPPRAHATVAVPGAPYVAADELPRLARAFEPQGTQLLLTEYVAGFNHHQGHVVVGLIRPGDALVLRPEPHNPHDALAVALHWHHFKLGYVPRNLNQPVAHLLAMGISLHARVVAVPDSAVPWQRVAFGVFMAPLAR